MKTNLRIPFQFGFSILAFLILVLSYNNQYTTMLVAFTALYGLTLISHLTFDLKRSKLFISVVSMFLLSSGMESVSSMIGQEYRLGWIYVSYTPFLVGYGLIFRSMLRNSKYRFEWNKYCFAILFLLAANAFIAYQLVDLLKSYDLGTGHLFYFFAFTVFKLFLLTLGILFYLTNKNKYKKITFLNWAFLCLLIADMSDITTSLFFGFHAVPVFSLLESALMCCALMLFYMYCISPNELSSLEHEKID